MPVGLQVLDESGIAIFDLNDFVGRVLGHVHIALSVGQTRTGTITNSKLTSGELFFYALPQSVAPAQGTWQSYFKASVSGSVLTWEAFSGPGSSITGYEFFYGVF